MAVRNEDFFVGDPDATNRFVESLQQKALSGEKLLLLAVLMDAVDCYKSNRNSKDRKKRVLFVEAEAWLFGREDDAIFSFNNVCEALGFDPEYLRAGLLGDRRNPDQRGVERDKRPRMSKPKRVA